MSTLTVTPEIQVFLNQLKDRTELRDADGNAIGIFTPHELAEDELYERVKGLFDLDEAERLLATEQPVHTTQEILQRLTAQGRAQ